MFDWLFFLFMLHWSVPVGVGLAIVVIFVICWREAGENTRRRDHGQCPKCGYDLLGKYADGCTECGWLREEQR